MDQPRVDSIVVEYYTVIPYAKDMKPGVLYVSKKYGTAIHLCCCGNCGNQSVTPIKPNWADGWDFSVDKIYPTLYPSIGNFNFPCKSHYFITAGKVVWC